MTATAADYAWIWDPFLHSFGDTYCMFWVRGMTGEELLEGLGARAERHVVGAEALPAVYDEDWDKSSSSQIVGATSIDGWALALQVNGTIGITERLMAPLSGGTRLISHHLNANWAGLFCWFEDRDVRLAFEPGQSWWRRGSDPDGLVEMMNQVGFGVNGEVPDALERNTEAVFALTEHLTGVRLTAEHLETANLACGVVEALPRSPSGASSG